MIEQGTKTAAPVDAADEDGGARRGRRPADGRRLRGERTRLAIIEAYLDLLQANVRQPTSAQIAEQAGCSVRSVFERFKDLRALSLATADHAIRIAQAEAVARDVDGDRATRLRSHVGTRARACEKWLPLWRAMAASQEDIAELKVRVMLTRYGNIERLRLMYRPELATLPPDEREALLQALAILISFESWDQLRFGFGHSFDSACAVWRLAIDRMLPSAPEPSS